MYVFGFLFAINGLPLGNYDWRDGKPRFIPGPGFAGGRFLQPRLSPEIDRLCHSSIHKAGGSERGSGHDGQGKMHRDFHCLLAVGSVIGGW